MMPHYKLISPRISADGARMINSGYDNTMAIVSKATMQTDGQKMEGQAERINLNRISSRELV